MKMERIWEKQRGESNNSKENTVKLGSAEAEQCLEIGHRRTEGTAGQRMAAEGKGRRMHRTREARVEEGIEKWGVAVGEMEAEGTGAGEGIRQPAAAAGARVEEGIEKWGVAVGEMEAEGTGAGEGIRQPAAAAGVDMGCHKLSTWNSRPDPWPRRWRKKGGRIW
uniref:Uncharacterized protein n=1 Tax=Cucumis sativus TaxID=3659 RepID=A0A0A0KB51_CUCSA